MHVDLVCLNCASTSSVINLTDNIIVTSGLGITESFVGCAIGKELIIDFCFFQAEDGIRDYKVTGVQTCALPISARRCTARSPAAGSTCRLAAPYAPTARPNCPAARAGRPDRSQERTSTDASAFPRRRSEEHTSELQSPCNLVCRLLLEKKK